MCIEVGPGLGASTRAASGGRGGGRVSCRGCMYYCIRLYSSSERGGGGGSEWPLVVGMLILQGPQVT